MKTILLVVTLFLSANAIADNHYPPSRDAYYQYLLMQERYKNSQPSYPGCDTCSLSIFQGDSATARMLRNDMWRMETGHRYGGDRNYYGY